MDTDSFEQRLRDHHDVLSASDRKLAEVLIANAKSLSAFSAAEMAQEAGVSKATAARFFRRLGYADFAAFRRQMRDRLSSSSPLQQMKTTAHRAGSKESPVAALARHLQQDQVRLALLAESLTPQTLQAALSLLQKASRVAVVGFRNSHVYALYAQLLLSQVRPGVTLLPDAAGRDADMLADIGKGDVLLVVDFRRRMRRLSTLVQACAKAGARVVLVTDSPVSTLAAQADAVLLCPATDSQVFDSYVGATSLVNFLATQLAQHGGRTTRARLARIEQAHALLSDLEPIH